MSDLDVQIKALAEITKDLETWLRTRAEELAAPQVEQANTGAAERVRAAESETTRQRDLVAELRRRLEALDRRRMAVNELLTAEGFSPGKAGVQQILGRMTCAEERLSCVRAIPRKPHESEQQGELGRAYTRGWESVIAALDAALADPAQPALNRDDHD